VFAKLLPIIGDKGGDAWFPWTDEFRRGVDALRLKTTSETYIIKDHSIRYQSMVYQTRLARENSL